MMPVEVMAGIIMMLMPAESDGEERKSNTGAITIGVAVSVRSVSVGIIAYRAASVDDVPGY